MCAHPAIRIAALLFYLWSRCDIYLAIEYSPDDYRLWLSGIYISEMDWLDSASASLTCAEANAHPCSCSFRDWYPTFEAGKFLG